MFNVIHLNALFLNKNIEKLKEIIQFLYKKKIKVGVVVLCETFLHTEVLNLVQFPDLNLYYNNR